MNVLDAIDRLARRREPEPDRIRHDAFLDDIAAHSPAAAAHFASRVTHLRTRVDHGPVTLAQVGVAGVVTAFGAMLFVVAGPPSNASYDSEPVVWAKPLMSLGVLLLALECVRRPLVVRRTSGLALALISLAVGCLAWAATGEVTVRGADDLVMAAIVVIGLAAGIALCGLALGANRTVRAGLKGVGIGAGGVFVADAAWVAIFMADRDGLHAVGSFASAAGALIMANGLIASRPEIRLRRVH